MFEMFNEEQSSKEKEKDKEKGKNRGATAKDKDKAEKELIEALSKWALMMDDERAQSMRDNNIVITTAVKHKFASVMSWTNEKFKSIGEETRKTEARSTRGTPGGNQWLFSTVRSTDLEKS